MKLLRATCECGFSTRKARVGYHFHRWWFPIIDNTTGELTDVSRSLPDDQVRLIQLCKVNADELHRPFLEFIIRELLSQFADACSVTFNPEIGGVVDCPRCHHLSLHVAPVDVTAVCEAGCTHEYQWHDSEDAGCPICKHRPHRFHIDSELRFAHHARTTSSCPCSSSMDSASHVDAYCPKCGELPDRYDTNGHSFCGRHHAEMAPYAVPKDLFFMEPTARWISNQFPNAKLWGDAEVVEAWMLMYCPVCESEHQRWLATKNAG